MRYSDITDGRQVGTFSFGQDNSGDAKKRKLQELSNQTQMMEYDNALKLSEQRRIAVLKQQQEIDARLASYRKQTEEQQRKASADRAAYTPVNQEQPRKVKQMVQEPARSAAPRKLFLDN